MGAGFFGVFSLKEGFSTPVAGHRRFERSKGRWFAAAALFLINEDGGGRMNRKKVLIAIGMAALLIGGGFLASPSALFAQEKTIVWNVPHTAAPSYYHILNLKLFAEKLKELSKGRMELRVHPASSLYPQNEQIPAVVDGRVEIAPIL